MNLRPLTNFRRLARIHPTLLVGALDELAERPDLWSLHTERQSFPGSAHHDTEVIFLRGPKEFTKESYFSIESDNYLFEANAVRKLWTLAVALFNILGAKEMGRVLIVRLKPLGEIDEHRDEGAYAEYFQRAHFCLSTDGQDFLASGDDSVTMLPGELWWFNHRVTHFGENCSPTVPRIHMILDYKL